MSRGDQVNTVVDNHLPDDWDDTPARREQILSVVEYFLETPTEMGLRERRIRAQRKAANDLDVAFNTIQSKCGRETWAEYVDSSDDYQRDHLEPALESISAELAGERDEQTQTTDRPSVWIEKTEQEGRRYKKEGKLRLGQAIYSPSEAKNGADVYSTMREAEVGDIVLHLLQDQYEIVGVSTIASELETDFEGLPEFGWEDHQKGYRRWLTGYEELTEPLNIYESVLDSVEHRERLDEIREEHTKLFYNSNRSLVQGGYLTQCPPELANIIAHESPEIAEQLSRRGYETTPEEVTMSSAETYDGIKEATTDVADRLSTRTTGPAWFDTQLTESIIEDWTTTLRGFEVGSKVTPEEEVRLQQIRTLYTVAESELSDRVDEIGSGSLENSLPEETLFMALVRLRQDQSGHLPNLNGHKMEILLDEEYQVVAPEETGTSHQQNGAESDAGVGKSGGSGSQQQDHPLLEQVRATGTEVYKMTAPADYWLTTYRYAALGFGESQKDLWSGIEAGDVLLLHSRREPSWEALPNQPSRIIGAGIVRAKTVKDNEQWWIDEVPSRPKDDRFEYIVAFERLYAGGDIDSIDFSRSIIDKMQDGFDSWEAPNPADDPTEQRFYDRNLTESVEQEIAALTDAGLDFEDANEISEDSVGSGFPARQILVSLSTDQAEALLEALVPKLTEVPPIALYPPFTGELDAQDILQGLYFQDDVGESITQQIEGALNAGKHVILTGPPGTGKTEIAQRVGEYLVEEYPYLYTEAQVTTATADWSTFDTVGGYMPSETDAEGNDLTFTPGIVLNRFKTRRENLQQCDPLVIDELNRADIDAAFGQLFTVLSGQAVQLPYTRDGQEIEVAPVETETLGDPHQYRIPNSWRMIGTLNTYDKTSLYEMSYAFMRRFSFIQVPAPDLAGQTPTELADLISSYAEQWNIDAADVGPSPTGEAFGDIGRVWQAANGAIEDRAIGPAVIRDMLGQLAATPSGAWRSQLTQTVISYIFPQLEGVPGRQQVVNELAEVGAVDETLLGQAAQDMLKVPVETDG